MSQRDFEAFLKDVIESGDAIIRYTAGKSFEDYSRETLLRDAVERRFTIIGEALTQARKLRRDFVPGSARGAIGFRNVLVHGYDDVKQREVWRIIHEDLPLLLDEVRLLLGPTPA